MYIFVDKCVAQELFLWLYFVGFFGLTSEDVWRSGTVSAAGFVSTLLFVFSLSAS